MRKLSLPTGVVSPEAAEPYERMQRRLADRVAPCEQSPDTWFSDDPRAVTAAIAGCTRCPVLAECRDYADAADERHGVWGGSDRSAPMRIARRKADNQWNEQRRRRTTMDDDCTDCGTSLVGVRPRLKVSSEPVCSSCAGRRMGWGDAHALTEIEGGCRDADAEYILQGIKEEA